MSVENLFKTRPVSQHKIHVHSYEYTLYIPTGFVSKNSIGARRILRNILLCKLRAAARHIKKVNIALNVTMVTAPPTIPEYIPILW